MLHVRSRDTGEEITERDAGEYFRQRKTVSPQSGSSTSRGWFVTSGGEGGLLFAMMDGTWEQCPDTWEVSVIELDR